MNQEDEILEVNDANAKVSSAIDEIMDDVSEEKKASEKEQVDSVPSDQDVVAQDEVIEEVIEPEFSRKKKISLIIILSILLILDVAALIIYIVGIDKVLSFVK